VGDGAARGHWFSALGPSRKSRLPLRKHGLDLRPPHLRNRGNSSLSTPAKTLPAGPPPPFLGGPCCRQAPILFSRQFLLVIFSFGLVACQQEASTFSALPLSGRCSAGPRTEVRGPWNVAPVRCGRCRPRAVVRRRWSVDRGPGPVERQPPCPRATTILAGFQAAEVGVSFNVSG
jgi:hypothetical protein